MITNNISKFYISHLLETIDSRDAEAMKYGYKNNHHREDENFKGNFTDLEHENARLRGFKDAHESQESWYKGFDTKAEHDQAKSEGLRKQDTRSDHEFAKSKGFKNNEEYHNFKKLNPTNNHRPQNNSKKIKSKFSKSKFSKSKVGAIVGGSLIVATVGKLAYNKYKNRKDEKEKKQ